MTYDYLCTSCGHAWEAEQRISEQPIKHCPACSELSAKRQISGGSGFILKGGGWYSDLYGSAKPAKNAEKSADATSAQSSGPGDNKPAKSGEKSSDTAAACAPSACGTSACPAAAAASST